MAERGTDLTVAASDELDVLIDLRNNVSDASIDVDEIPFMDLAAQHQPIKEEILAEWSDILTTASFVGGERVERFESALAEYCGTSHAVAVANGTDAITLALRALGLQPGDEVITAANTFYATVEAIVHAGGVPVLVDVDPTTATIDPDGIEAVITNKTRFILPVHLYGQPADMGAIMSIADRHGLLVVEDNAQAIGATYKEQRTGSIGHAGAVSFYPGKNLGATGDAGAVTTNSREVARNIRILRDHGSSGKNNHVVIGYNSRLDTVHAVALLIKLKHLDAWNDARNTVADTYLNLLETTAVDLPEVGADRTHVFHLFVVRHRERDRLREALGAAGISTGLHYPTPIHLTGPFQQLGDGPGTFPISEDWATRGLSLPMFPDLTIPSASRVAAAIESFLVAENVLTFNTV